MRSHSPWSYTDEWADGTSVTNSTYKIGLRYYDGLLHRWTQTDPLERITNPAQPAETQPYTYVGCNPTNQTDPTGAYSWDSFWDDVAVVQDQAVTGLLGGSVAGCFAGGHHGCAVGAVSGFAGGTATGLYTVFTD